MTLGIYLLQDENCPAVLGKSLYQTGIASTCCLATGTIGLHTGNSILAVYWDTADSLTGKSQYQMRNNAVRSIDIWDIHNCEPYFVLHSYLHSFTLIDMWWKLTRSFLYVSNFFSGWPWAFVSSLLTFSNRQKHEQDLIHMNRFSICHTVPKSILLIMFSVSY